MRAELIALSASGAISPGALQGSRELYDLHVGDERFHLQVGRESDATERAFDRLFDVAPAGQIYLGA